MTDRWVVRFGGPFAIVAAVFWMLADLGRRISPDADDWDCNSRADYVTNGVGATAILVTSLALLGVYGFHRTRFGWLGRLGSSAAIVGTLAAGINNPIEHCGGVESMGIFVWVPSVLLWVFGSIVMGVAMLRAHLFPYVVVSAFIGGTLLGVVAFNSIGLIAYSFSWWIVGAAMLLAHVDRLAEVQ